MKEQAEVDAYIKYHHHYHYQLLLLYFIPILLCANMCVCFLSCMLSENNAILSQQHATELPGMIVAICRIYSMEIC